MKTEEYLGQIDRYRQMISNKMDEIKELEYIACGISSSPTDSERIQTTLTPDKIGNAVAKICEQEDELNDIVCKYLEKRKKIISQIDSIKDTRKYQMLTLRYVKNMQFPEIEEEMNYSRATVNRLYNASIVEFEKQFGSTYLKHETF